MGTLARLAREKQVKNIDFIFFSYPYGSNHKVLDNEEKTARMLLEQPGIQITTRIFINFEVRRLDKDRHKILNALVSLDRLHRPDCVFVPCSHDIHQDHKVIYEEARRAFKDRTILGYDCCWNLIKEGVAQDLFVELSIQDVEMKIKTAHSYTSQLDKLFLQDAYIRAVVKRNGLMIKKKFAESFEVIRGVI